MTNPSDIEISKALDVLSAAGKSRSSKEICKLKDAQKSEYKSLLDEVDRLNKLQNGAPGVPSNLSNLKGAALEKLVKYLLQISGDIFEVNRNLRTSTNEIDDLVTLNSKGRILLANGLIDKRFEIYLGECKNYEKAVSVTYIGKFCSLLLTTSVKLGILFSYYGVSGSGWSNGAGLIKKFYLHKEKPEERYCIIDFSFDDFQAIYNGENFLDIIEGKVKSLQFDTDYTRYISKHPAE